jgi:hypothetical protein
MILEVPPVLVRKLVTVVVKSEVSMQSGCPPQAFVGLCADAHTCDERIRMKIAKSLRLVVIGMVPPRCFPAKADFGNAPARCRGRVRKNRVPAAGPL